jgi:glycolate oxidase FAD binding subunit
MNPMTSSFEASGEREGVSPPLNCTIDGFGPVPVIAPKSVLELSQAVARASVDALAIYPIGGRTRLNYGLPPSRPGIAPDLSNLHQVIDYPARDMTITVHSGIRIARLQEVLAAENQHLPVDVPLSAEATLGGAIATNQSGPRRYGFGTFRDYVIGISVVNNERQEIKAGGRVVKNVAGYDLCKLYVGSFGTLGIITQVTLKLKPKPEASTLLTFACPVERLEDALGNLHTTRTRPVTISLLSPRASVGGIPDVETSDAWLIIVGFADTREVVNWQVNQVQKEFSAFGIALGQQWNDRAAEPSWEGLTDYPLRITAPITFQANMLPSHTATFCRRAAELSANVRLLAHAGNGIVIGHFPQDLTLERAASMLMILQDLATTAQGNLVLQRCPTEWKKRLPVWGRPRNDVRLMRSVKERLDPRRVFNPGRFLDGL